MYRFEKKIVAYVLSIDLNLIFMEGETALLSHWEIEKSIFF